MVPNKLINGVPYPYVIPVGEDAGFQTVKGQAGVVTVAPATSAGAYSANDIVGGLLTLDVSALVAAGGVVLLQTVDITIKTDVSPTWTVVLLDANPSGSTVADNAAFSIVAADAFKVVAAFTFSGLGGSNIDMGTPHTFHLGNLALPIKTVTTNLYALLVDGTGVTLGSVADMQAKFGFVVP